MPEKLSKWIIASLGIIFVWMAFFFPVWEGFDEPAHFCYIQHLVENREIPNPPGIGQTDYCSTEVELTFAALPINQTIGNSPQIAAFAYPEYQQYWKSKIDALPVQIPNDITLRNSTHQILDIWEAQHPPLPYLVLSIPYIIAYAANFFVRFLLLRLVSMGMVLIGVWVMWKAMSIIIQDAWARLFGFSALVLSPMFIFHFSRISNEPQTFLLFSLLWYFLMRLFTEKQSPRSLYIWIGLVCGLGILSKVFFLACMPALVLALLMDFVSKWKETQQRKSGLLGYLTIAIFTLIPAVPWYIYQHLGFVTPGLGFEDQSATTLSTLIPRILSAPWLPYFKEVFLNFVGLWGWSFMRGPFWFYLIYGIFWYFTISGMSKTHHLERRIVWSAILFPMLILAGMSYYQLRFDYLAITGGWYLYSVSAMLATVVALVWQARIPKKWRKHAFYAMTIFHLLCFIWITFHYLIPHYYAI